MGVLDGKVCIVTGGGGSLGSESARIMLKEGARVMLVDNKKELLEKSKSELGGETDAVSYVVADLSDTQQTRNYVGRTVEKWGNVDVLFSNAGISGVIKPITEFPEEVFDAVMAVKVRASFLACKYALLWQTGE
jgi:NAD(P)-dependent dehydrogenase (short-subunit alcohol dehydrogenase family)